jgi:hypothetical protein
MQQATCNTELIYVWHLMVDLGRGGTHRRHYLRLRLPPTGRRGDVGGVAIVGIALGHTAVWVVLAASCVIRALSPQSSGIANNIAFLALPLYGLFLFTMVGIRQ